MTGGSDRTDICLIMPPCADVSFPHLGTAVLKTACQRQGLSTRIVYGNLMLAARIGYESYAAIDKTPLRAMVGDLLFRDLAYPPDVVATLAAPEPLAPEIQALFDRIAPAIEPAVNEMVDEILAMRPRILGLSSTFQQTMACSAIARLVKARAPDIRIVLGGANAAWPICLGLSRAFPWIDHVFAGESDIDFPEFCARLIHDGVVPAERVIRSQAIRDMSVVSVPDFSDYFTTLRALQAGGSLPVRYRTTSPQKARAAAGGARKVIAPFAA